MSSSPSGLFFAEKVLGEEGDLMSSSPSCLFFAGKSSWRGCRLNVVLPILIVFAVAVFVSCLGEEVEIMSSSPSCQFLLEVIFRLGVLY